MLESQGLDVDRYMREETEAKRLRKLEAVECSICEEMVNKEDIAPKCDWLHPDEPICSVCLNALIDAELS